MRSRKAEILRRAQFPSYAVKLKHLTGLTIKLSDLNTPEHVAEFNSKIKPLLGDPPAIEFAIRFSDIQSAKFVAFIKELSMLNPGPVSIWISQTNYCGDLEIPSISELRLDFEFNSLPDGLVCLCTIDGKDRMVFDLELDGDGQSRESQILSVLVYGDNWSRAKIPSLKTLQVQ